MEKKPSGLCSAHRDGEDSNCKTCFPEPNGVGGILEKLNKFYGLMFEAGDFDALYNLVSNGLKEQFQAGVIKGLSQNGNITYEPPEEQAYRRGMEAGVSAERERWQWLIPGSKDEQSGYDKWAIGYNQCITDLLREDK